MCYYIFNPESLQCGFGGARPKEIVRVSILLQIHLSFHGQVYIYILARVQRIHRSMQSA
jgi:hypothetical protein